MADEIKVAVTSTDIRQAVMRYGELCFQRSSTPDEIKDSFDAAMKAIRTHAIQHRAEERERCEKVCHEYSQQLYEGSSSTPRAAGSMAASVCELRIRALPLTGETT